jgi:hypothetical protein
MFWVKTGLSLKYDPIKPKWAGRAEDQTPAAQVFCAFGCDEERFGV